MPPTDNWMPPRDPNDDDDKEDEEGEDLLIVLSVLGFIGLAAGLYEVDRREKSTLTTAERNFAEIEQRVQVLGNQIHILNDQLTARLIESERRLQALNGLGQLAVSHRYRAVPGKPAGVSRKLCWSRLRLSRR